MEKKKHALRQLLVAVEKELLRKPNRKTLDRLSLLAGFQDWDDFQEALHGEANAQTNYELKDKKKETTPKWKKRQPGIRLSLFYACVRVTTITLQ